MTFSTYTWAQPPHTVKISYTRKTEVAPDGAGAWTVTDLGRLGRVVEGEGSFCGPYAHEYFQGLEELFLTGQEALFTMAPWKPFMAIMTELSMIEEPCENYLQYRFRLVETPTQATA